jgi:Raf kinase inhibitor-like YbhB/YbcL family protein
VGTWVHWVLFDIPASIQALPEQVPPDQEVDGVGTHGANSWRRLGYGGPCPPKGPAHRYFFKLYALDTTPSLSAGASKADVEKAMEGHILAQGELVGTYRRR